AGYRVHRVQERRRRPPSTGATHRGCLRAVRGRVAAVPSRGWPDAAPRARPRRLRKLRLMLHLQVASRAAPVPALADVRRWGHALLHLQGHDHLRPGDTARMEALEKKLLAKLGYPDPYDDSG